MRHILIVLLIAIALSYFSVSGYSAVICQIQDTRGSGICAGSYEDVLHLNSTLGGHVAKSGSSYYRQYTLCCIDNINDALVVEDISCTPDLRLSATSNAHVQRGDLYSDYPELMCLESNNPNTNFNCQFQSGSCSPTFDCILSISDNDNAHVGICATYNTKLCCETQSVNNPPVLQTLSRLAPSSFLPNLWVGAAGSPMTAYAYGSDPDGNIMRPRCGTTQGANDLCTGSWSGSPSNMSCSFSSPWNIEGLQTFWCNLEDDQGGSSLNVSTWINVDPTLPGATIVKDANYIGANTVVTYTVTANDFGGSGLYDSAISINTGFQQICTSPPSLCQYSEGGYMEGKNITYQSRVRDYAGNINWTLPATFIVCNLTSVAFNHSCGILGCRAGDDITVTATFNGACPNTLPDTSFIQTDAKSSDDTCIIQSSGGNMAGVGIAGCTSSPCQKDWVVPAIPNECKGKTVNYIASALWKNSVTGNPQDWFTGLTPSGSFLLFGGAAPGVIAAHKPDTGPIYPTTPVIVNATAADDVTVENISIFVYNSAGSLLSRTNCIAIPPRTPYSCETSPQTYPYGTYYYNASAYDDEDNIGWSSTGSFTVEDPTPPLVSVSHDPLEIGQTILVTFTATASDIESGISSITINVYTGSDVLRNSTTCASSPCNLVLNDLLQGEVIRYNATAVNGFSLEGKDPSPTGYYTFTVCQLDGVVIAQDRCSVTGCRKDDTINVTANYHGACPAASLIQVDATDGDAGADECKIERNFGSMQGINVTCTSGTCKEHWIIPVAPPAECLGETINAGPSALWKGGIGGGEGGTWFSGVAATGSFMFSATGDVSPSINVAVNPAPPFDETVLAFLNATATDDNVITYINISIDNGAVFVACTPAPPRSPYWCEMIPQTFAEGTHTYIAYAIDDTNNVNFEAGFFDVLAGPDFVPPVVTAARTPSEIRPLVTVVTINVTGNDTGGSGIKEILVFINNTLRNNCIGSGSEVETCIANDGPHAAGQGMTYQGNATDFGNNSAVSALSSYVVCNLNTTSLIAVCTGPSSQCKANDNISLNARRQAVSSCPTSSGYIQIDAASSDNECIINANSGDLIGMNRSCLFGAGNQCIGLGFWRIPLPVPLQCMGKTMVPTAGALWKYAVTAGEWWDAAESNTGTFKFYFDSTNVALVLNLTLSTTTPNLGDVLAANLSCTLKRGAEQAPCSNDIAIIDITIDGTDYIAQTGWDQNSNYDAGNNIWTIPVDTNIFRSDVKVNLTYETISNITNASYFINYPPEISNVNHTPISPAVGDDVNFSAHLKDPDAPQRSSGIDVARVCRNTGCTGAGDPYCLMNLISGDQIEGDWQCTYPNIQSADKFYRIIVNDTKGATNVSDQYVLQVTDEKMYVYVTYTDVGNLVPLTSGSVPNFTRGMPMNFVVTAEVRNRTSGLLIETCSGDVGGNCNAFYSGPSNKISWDGFVNAWKGNITSGAFPCDQESATSPFIVERTADGLFGQNATQIYVSCVPRVVVDPLEARLVLGTYMLNVFRATIFNPFDQDTFDLEMISDDPDTLPLPWVSFVCDAGDADCGLDITGDKAVLTVDKLSSHGINVYMDSPGRAGVFPIIFRANTSSTNRYETTGSLLIFAESLDEFALWQLAVILLIAGLLYVRLGRKK